MSSASLKNDQLMFGELLAYLRQHGFGIGVDHYLRLQQLLDKIGGRCAPNELRTLLCPIFATSKAQQEQFYRAFDSYFDFFQLPDEQAELEQSAEATQSPARTLESKRARKRWLYVATPVALAMLLIAFALFPKQKPAEQPATNQASATPTPDIAANSPAPAMTVQVNEANAPAQTSTPTPTPTPAPTPQPGFYQRYRTAIHLSIILAPLLLFLLYEWYRFARRKLLLQKQQTRKPPFVWPIRVDAPEGGLHASEQFLTAARLMRRRQVDEFHRLDIEATVAATIDRLGFPDFRYKSDSRVPEYLVLIDRASPRDHQAQLFDELTQALEREGVFVTRYFFDGEPRVCRDERGAGVVQLAELQNRFGSHRLIIFSNGEKLLDQITGRLDGWTAIFNHWQDRALLTIENPARWGLREIALAQMFVVLPATFNGLLALVDHFETTVPEDLRSWARGGFETPALETTPEETIAALRRSLGEETFQWLAACAVYTELHWSLTLHLGSLPSMPPGLVKEENLLKLIRLPWFRTGAIPDEVRWLLINELTPERQKSIRAAIIELLEKDPAPPETFASDQYRLNLFAQRWLQSRTRKRLRELLELMKRLPRSQVVRDLTLIRFLESSQRSPLDFLLPNRLRKLFYHRGVSAFGLKTGARFLITLLLMGAAGLWWTLSSPPHLPGQQAEAKEEDSTSANERILSYWLTVQKFRNRISYEAPFETSTRQILESGWSFRLNISSPQAGYLYILSEPNAEVGANYNMIYPSPQINGGSSRLAANQPLQTGMLGFDKNEGTERIWIIWSAQPVAEFEEVRGALDSHQGAVPWYVLDPYVVQNFLDNNLSSRAKTLAEAENRMIVKSEGELLIELVELKHLAETEQTYPEAQNQESQQTSGEVVSRKTEILVPVETPKKESKAPVLPSGTLAGSGTERGVTSVPGVLGDNTQPGGQPPIIDETPPPPMPTTVPQTTPKTDAPYNVGSLKDKAKSLASPSYPRALALQASGVVQVEVVLDESGKVISARAISGSKLLHQSAVEAVYKSVFRPILINGQPAKVRGFISYSFAGAQQTDEMRQGPQRQPGQQEPRRLPQPPPGRRPG